MTRTIELELKDFQRTSPSLIDPASNAPVAEVAVAVKKLFHQYFLAKYRDSAEDTGAYEYERQLTDGPDWRFKGQGIGADEEAKRNVSNELGKAFARWFLYEHLDFTYFAPLEDLLGRRNSDGTQWTRKTAGDLPDYVCGKHIGDVNLLEAKGRYDSVTFRTKEFQSFRDQVQRAQLLDVAGRALQVKGFIGVTRWATQAKPRVRSKLLVEDPTTEGAAPRTRLSTTDRAGHDRGSLLARFRLSSAAAARRSAS